MTIGEAIKHAEEVAEIKKIESETAEIQGCDRYALKCEECAEEHRQLAEWLRDYKRLKEQEPTVTSTNNSGEMVYPQVDKKVESYKKLLKHPVIKHIMDMDETQEELDFVQPHKRIPVTLAVGSGDLISRQAVMDYIHRILNQGTGKKKSFDFIQKYVTNMPSVKPQEPTGHWIIIDDCEKFIAKCSKCGQIEDSRMVGKYAYCHCGVRMIEERNE